MTISSPGPSVKLDSRRTPQNGTSAKSVDGSWGLIKEYKRFQLEATKLGRNVVFQVTVFEKTERSGKKLFAETQCSDPLHFIIQFVIKEAATFEKLIEKFLRQLNHRGFTPLRMRTRGEIRWNEWRQLNSKVPQ